MLGAGRHGQPLARAEPLTRAEPVATAIAIAAVTLAPTAFAAAAHTATPVTTTSLAPAPIAASSSLAPASIAASFPNAVTAQGMLPKDGRGARSTRSSLGALPHWPGAPEPDQAASYAST